MVSYSIHFDTRSSPKRQPAICYLTLKRKSCPIHHVSKSPMIKLRNGHYCAYNVECIWIFVWVLTVWANVGCSIKGFQSCLRGWTEAPIILEIWFRVLHWGILHWISYEFRGWTFMKRAPGKRRKMKRETLCFFSSSSSSSTSSSSSCSSPSCSSPLFISFRFVSLGFCFVFFLFIWFGFAFFVDLAGFVHYEWLSTEDSLSLSLSLSFSSIAAFLEMAVKK